MQARPIAHPTDDVLVALGSGKLDLATADTVLAHLDTCPDCLSRATSLSGDELLRRVRAARSMWPQTRDGNTPAERSTAGTPEPYRTTSRVGPAIPPELRANEHYEILRELGRGGMGVVYLARHRLTRRLDVLKVVSRNLLDQAGATQRFLSEIELASRLADPNIVTAYSALQIGDLLVFAMEYVEGKDLSRLVKENGPLPIEDACSYAAQTARGLQHAHEKGLVHRDIKPHNLMLKREGNRHTVKILDFGLAKAKREEERSGSDLTGQGMALGTPEYIAPEQAMDAATADIRADIYSLGCTLYYLLSGSPPFRGNSVYELLIAHQTATPTPLNEVRRGVPAELAAVVARMMAKTPVQRYQTPDEVATALTPFVRGMAADSTEDMSKPTILPPPSKKRRPRWPLFIGGIAALLFVGMIGLLASGVFRVKTPQGTLVVEVDAKDFEVFVDGERVKVNWENGGKTAVIGLRPGTRTVEVKKDGLTFRSPGEVEILDGKRRIIKVAIEPDEKVPVLPPGYDLAGGFRFVHFGRERTLVVSSSTDDTLKRYYLQIFDLESGLPHSQPLEHRGPISARAFSPDGTQVVTGSIDRTAQVWDSATGKKVTPTLKHNGVVCYVAFSPDGNSVATASYDKTARIWDARSGKALSPPLVHKDWVIRVAFSPDGKRVITGSQDTTAQLWEVSTGKKLTPTLKHEDIVSHVTFSPDGNRVATASFDKTAQVWDAHTGKPVGSSIEHGQQVNHVMFSPDGKRIVTASHDATARVWDARTGKAISPVLAHNGPVTRAMFSPDGLRVVTGGPGKDHVVRIWDVGTGKLLAKPLQMDTAGFGWFSPDGKRVVTSSLDGVRRAWDARTGKEVYRSPVVVATFTFQINQEAEHRYTFYSNGRLNSPSNEDTWEVNGKALTFRWKRKDAPDGVWVNECFLSSDGRTFTGELQKLKHRYTGRQVSGRDLTKWPPYRR